jgi:agmatine deiminase
VIYFSSILNNKDEVCKLFGDCANNIFEETSELFDTLKLKHIDCKPLHNTRDIWVRDFMPVVTKGGKLVQFRYEPSYLKSPKYRKLRSDPDAVCSANGITPDEVSNINLDGGNVVFSPSKEKAIISERVFSENPERDADELVQELKQLLETEIIMIPALPQKNDMTGHADGMVRFLDENTVVGNNVEDDNESEQNIKAALAKHDIDVIDFPYFELYENDDPERISAVGCYINYLETDTYIFLPTFDDKRDGDAIKKAERIFKEFKKEKEVVPVDHINAIAKEGGVLNCISWER